MTVTAQAFQAYDATATTISLGRLLEWLKILRPENLAALKELLPALDAFIKAPDTKGRVKASIGLMVIVTRLTPTKTDDNLVQMLQTLLDDELIDILVNLLEGFSNRGAHIQSVEAMAADKAKAEAKGVPWGFLMQVALQIFQLLQEQNSK